MKGEAKCQYDAYGKHGEREITIYWNRSAKGIIRVQRSNDPNCTKSVSLFHRAFQAAAKEKKVLPIKELSYCENSNQGIDERSGVSRDPTISRTEIGKPFKGETSSGREII